LITVKVSADGRSHICCWCAERQSALPLIQINLYRPFVDNTHQLLATCPSPARSPLTEQPKLRFAVGTFDSWQQVREALNDLRVRGLVLDSFNCLAQERMFAGSIILAPDQRPVVVEALPFPGSREQIAGTRGPLAGCLLEGLRSGAKGLK
jgi:hypothetical protein